MEMQQKGVAKRGRVRILARAKKDIAGAYASEFFPTPEWATMGLLDNEIIDGGIWECACGDGAMAKVLRRAGHSVIASDLNDRGYGEAGVDFLTAHRIVRNIVTNPPFSLAQKFAERALGIAHEKVALLLPLSFLEGQARASSIFRRAPPRRVWIFSERLSFYPPGVEARGNGPRAFAWFVWDKTDPRARPELGWIAPGTRDKYSR